MNSRPEAKTTYTLHYLPNRGQNLFYILFLILSPLLNLAIYIFAFEDFRRASQEGEKNFGNWHSLSEISGDILGAILVVLGINLIFTLLRRHHHIRKSLLLFGIFSSLYLFLNLSTISYGIFAFKVQSVALLLVSMGIYCSLNIVFLFWYWYLDYPTQVKHLHHPDYPVQIRFPTSRQTSPSRWAPNFLDYLYLTIMVSNTLGSPEDHCAMGSRVKAVQIIHSTTMLILLVIFVSRAINTLS